MQTAKIKNAVVRNAARLLLAAMMAQSFSSAVFIPAAHAATSPMIAGGIHHVVALDDNGDVWAWGNNEDGQIGDGNSGLGVHVDTPYQVTTVSNAVAVSAGRSFSVALKADGTVWTWGNGAGGALGDGTGLSSTTPVQVVGVGGSGTLTGIIAVAAGGFHVLALKSDGTVVAWGSGSSGQLGDGAFTGSLYPIAVPALTDVTAVAAGDAHSLVLKSDGSVWAWGWNITGQIGNDDTGVDAGSPVQVVGVGNSGFLANVTGIAGGELHSTAVLSDGSVVAWGYNGDGELGDGTNSDSGYPVTVSGITTATAVGEHAWSYSMALLSDRSVRTWGSNLYGTLGINTNGGSSNTPVQVHGVGDSGFLSDVYMVAGSGTTALAIMCDGTVVGWGHNLLGEIGNGTTTESDVPAPASGLNLGATCVAGPGGTDGVSDVLSREKQGEDSTHAITITLSAATTAGTVTLTYANNGGTDFDFTGASIADGGGDCPTSNFVGGVGTLSFDVPVDGANCVAGKTVKVDVTSSVTNSDAVGSHSVSISGTVITGAFAIPITSDDQISVTATVNPYITFQVVATDVACSHGTDDLSTDNSEFGNNGGTVAFGTLVPTAVSSSQDAAGIKHVCTFVSTNATSGYALTVQSLNGGLTNGTQYINAEATEVPGTNTGSQTLTSGSEGYGLCLSTTTVPNMDVTLPAGSNLVGASPFNPGTCNDTSGAVGKLTTGIQTIGSNGSSPVQEGTAQWNLKTSIAATTGAGSYTDTLTFIATGTF